MKSSVQTKKTESKNVRRLLMAASVASMIDQFNMPNIRLLQELGYEVHVTCNFYEGNTCNEANIRRLQKTLSAMHVKFHQWDCPRSLCAVGKCLKAYIQILRLTSQFTFHVIHCHSPIGGVIARIVAHIRGIPVIYTAHGFHFYKDAPLKNWLLYYPAERLLAYWTDVLITVNQDDYVFAKQNLRTKKVYRIPGVGIDITRFAESDPILCREFRKRYKIPEKAILLLSVGELNENKNHRVVLDALARIHNRNIYYFICGQGQLRGWLLRYAARLGIESQTRVPGYVEDIVTAYHSADIFIIPSKREGMPVALLEAMAAGLPCVVSDIRGCRELIAGSMRFHSNRPEELTEILQWVVNDKRMLAECGRLNQRRVRKYDLAVVEEPMKKIYQCLWKSGCV